MPDNTPETQSILPVMQADREAAAQAYHTVAKGYMQVIGCAMEAGAADEKALVQLFARHRISHSLPGDVGTSEWMNLMPREVVARAALAEGCRDETADNIRYGFHRDVKIRAEAAVKLVASIQDDVRAALTPSALSGDNSQSGVDEAKKRTAINGILAGLLLPLVADPKELIALGNQACTEILASLSTPTAEPMGEETLGRFGHHPDPATDFEHEVDQIEAIITDLEKGMRAGEAIPLDRIDLAMGFRVGGDAGAVAAKASLRKLETRALALTTPQTPDRIGKDAVRDIAYRVAVARQGRKDTPSCEAPSEYAVGRALDDVKDVLAALSATPAQEGER